MLIDIDTEATMLEEIFCNSNWTLWCWGWHLLHNQLHDVSLCLYFPSKVPNVYLVIRRIMSQKAFWKHFFCNCNKYIRQVTLPQRKSVGIRAFEFEQMKEEEERVEKADLRRKPAVVYVPRKSWLVEHRCSGGVSSADLRSSCELNSCLSQSQW